MSIEQSLSALAESNNTLAAALTQAANAIAAAMQGNSLVAEAPAAPAAPKAAAGKPRATPAPAAPASPAPGQRTAAAAPAAAQSSKALNYDEDIRPLFLELINKKDKAAGRNFIDSYDPSKSRLSEAITPAQYPEVLERLKQELGIE